MNKDEEFMHLAIELAKNGEGWTNPNPLVGAVIVKDGKIIGKGWHHKYGDLHAERDALQNMKENGNDGKGAAIYVTLEPCCHFGKQPPCTEALVEAGIKKVFVGSRDPNPLVHGKGNEYLRAHGIEVTEDFLREECDALNPIFFHFITKNLPYCALKYAMTMDGKIACTTGDSKWITGEKSRAFVQTLRNRYAAILCGIGTVLADDPMLNCRLENGNNPVRIICDSNLRIPLNSKIVQSSASIRTIIACARLNDFFDEKRKALENAGIEIIECGENHVELKKLMEILGSRKIDSVLIEGGGEINYSALEAGIVNHIYAFIAPKLFGGNAKTPVSGQGVSHPDQAFMFKQKKITQFDEDILIEYEKSE